MFQIFKFLIKIFDHISSISSRATEDSVICIHIDRDFLVGSLIPPTV